MLNQNFTTKAKLKSNQKYSHLSEDSQRFLEYCDKHDVSPIQKHIGKSAEFETRPFSNSEPYPDYFCVRFLALYANRELLCSWSLYQLKDGDFLVHVNDFGPPSVMMYQMQYDDFSEIEADCIAPSELIADAKQALKKMQPQTYQDRIANNVEDVKQFWEQQDETEQQSMVGIPTQEAKPVIAIKPKKSKGKLKSAEELREVSEKLLQTPHVPTTKDNYYLGIDVW